CPGCERTASDEQGTAAKTRSDDAAARKERDAARPYGHGGAFREFGRCGTGIIRRTHQTAQTCRKKCSGAGASLWEIAGAGFPLEFTLGPRFARTRARE